MYWYFVYLLIIVFIVGKIRGYLNNKWFPFVLNGKHVFITGGSEGLGLSIAKQCFMRGATVTIVSWNEEKLKKAVQEIDGSSRDYVQYFVLDVAKASVEEIQTIVKQAEKKLGRIEVLFNNAGFCKPGMFFEEKFDPLENAW